MADIKANGLQHPITIYENQILDGRHRFIACQKAKVKPEFRNYDGDDPVNYVISLNLHRRHLNEAQRAMVAAKLENAQQGRPQKIDPENKDANCVITREKAALALNISQRSIATASKILDEHPKLAKEVTNGQISLHAAEKKVNELAAEKEIKLDKTGWEIPDKILPLWNEATALARERLNTMSKMKVEFETAQKEKNPIFHELAITGAIAGAQGLYGDWKRVLPHAVCPSCLGKTSASCTMCKKRGYVSEFFWNRCVPVEQKQMREKILAAKK